MTRTMNTNTVAPLRHACLALACCLLSLPLVAQTTPLNLEPNDVIPTGNEWIALPDIYASDGALGTFNAISMQFRGLLQSSGEHNGPVLTPYFTADGAPLALHNPKWEVAGYWTPTARQTINGMEATLTYCAPPGSRGAFVRLTLTNRRAKEAEVELGVRAQFGSLNRVTYVPVELHGTRMVGTAPWVDDGEVFSYITDDTKYAWSFIHPGMKAEVSAPPLSGVPASNAVKEAKLAPGETAEALFIFAPGIEEFSAAHNARALKELLIRHGADAIIAQAAEWSGKRTRTTGQADLDLLMNRNYLFNEMYAWGRTIDTEQWVGVTSRSPRYYVSAAYWDRDAMLWSFPALLDVDPEMAQHALEYALTIQLKNTGTHSRFIDGVVLEDGFQLDEAVAPVIALGDYVKRTGDVAFAETHKAALEFLRARIAGRRDAATGLYSSLQDAQDEFQVLPFITYDNALTWRALLSMADIYGKLGDGAAAKELTKNADELHAAVLKYCIRNDAPGADGTVFASATDGKKAIFTEMPPGSMMKLPLVGFVAEDDPVFVRTYRWLHSSNYKYSFSNEPYGLPGSYRLLFTAVWEVADHMRLKLGHEQAMKILRGSNWDGGIITEGVHANTGRMDMEGRAFATAAGYMAHSICESACTDKAR